MTHLSRRHLLRSAGLLAGAVALGACDTAPNARGGKGTGTLTWWDHFQPLSDLEKELFARFEKQSGGLPVEYTVYNPKDQGPALQLAKQSNQLPDVFTTAGVNLRPSQLYAAEWFSPLQLSEQAKAALPADALLEGVTVFDGKPHSFSQFSFRQYNSLNWFNTDLFDKAGLDPENPPATYDDFRAAAKAIRSKGGDNVYGVVLPIQFAERIGFLACELAQAAGSPTAFNFGVDLRTGEYAFHGDEFVHAIEFLLSLKQDGVLFPASTSLDARNARARWCTGIAGFFFDGSWNIGVIADSFKAFTDKVGVGSVLVPEAGMKPVQYSPPKDGTFYIAHNSKHAEAASALMSMILEPGYQRKLAENMDQPPLDLAAAGKADVHPTYTKALELFTNEVFLAPDPRVKNTATAAVQGEMKEIKPNIGELVQGAFSGKITDVRAALKELSDKHEAERERAIKKVTADGAKVTVDDWAFPNWQPAKDYGSESYQ